MSELSTPYLADFVTRKNENCNLRSIYTALPSQVANQLARSTRVETRRALCQDTEHIIPSVSTSKSLHSATFVQAVP